MTQYFDFVALGWIEKYLREEIEAAARCLKSYEREPDESIHLQEALCNVHSATGVLRLCTLDPAALLTEEIERVISQLIDGAIAGEARKLAMTDLVAAMEALPAYLANVRAKREVSAGVLANVINDMRHFGNRPPLPDSLFFNPPIKPGAGISKVPQLAEDRKLRQFGARAVQLSHRYSKLALNRDHEALKGLYAVGKHAAPLLAGTPMEPYFRCYTGLIEALAQRHAVSDEVIVDIFKHCFVFLRSLARRGSAAIDETNPTPFIKKMLYYIAKTPSPTVLQQTLRDTFGVQNVDDVRIESSGRLIQEDDLLEALSHTMSQLLEVMEFITIENRNICSSNANLQNTIVPRLRQVSIQLKAIGLDTHSETIAEQHAALEALSLREEPVEQAELLDFGGALVAVKESLEHKLKHGLYAHGDSMEHDLDVAIMGQTVRCLNDMKCSINREFARKDLLEFMEEVRRGDGSPLSRMRPLYRAATLVDDPEVEQAITNWERGETPSPKDIVPVAEKLLAGIPELAYAEQAAADMEQVLSVLGLLAEKKQEYAVLADCTSYIRESIGLGGIVNDAGMACFAEAVAALEQYMERRTADPLGNADEHLERAAARAKMLASFISQRVNAAASTDNVLDFDSSQGDIPVDESAMDEELDLSNIGTIEVRNKVKPEATKTSPKEKSKPARTNVFELLPAAAEHSGGQEDKAGVPWQEALNSWRTQRIERSLDAPLEDPSVDIDEELVDLFVEEAGKYIRKLEDAVPRFAAELNEEQVILEIRAVFHTMKGSARTIELLEFGEFMYDMEKIFNAVRDGYIQGSEEIVELAQAVTDRLPEITRLLSIRVPLYTKDFYIPHSIAAAMAEKRFEPASMRIVVEESTSLLEQLSRPAEVSKPASVTELPARKKEAEPANIWSRKDAGEIVAGVAAILEAAEAEATENLHADVLIRSLIPALVELRDAEFLSLDESTMGYFLDLPVIEQLASNAVFGLIDNGEGQFFKFPLSTNVVQGLQGYLSELLDIDEDEDCVAELHYMVAKFIRSALALPDVAPPVASPNQPSDAALRHFEVDQLFTRDDYVEHELETVDLDDISADLEASPELEAAPEAEPEAEPEAPQDLAAETETVEPEKKEEGSPSPKPEAAMEPEPAPEDKVADDIDDELMELFIETLDDYMESIDTAMAEIAKKDEAAVRRLKNTLHTIKGGANSVGVRNFGTLIHKFESKICDLEYEGTITSKAGLNEVYPLVDSLQQAARFMRSQNIDWDAEKAAALNSAANVSGDVGANDTVEEPQAESRVDTLRVSTHKIDHMLDTGLEISMNNVRSRRALDSAKQDGQEVQGLALRIQNVVDKLSLQLDIEIQTKTEAMPAGEKFDPLEMDRITEKQSLAAILREAAYDLAEEARALGEHINSAMRETISAGRLIENNQTEMRLLRLVSFSKLGPGFRRLVHQVSRQLDKQVDFEFTCDEGGLDVGVFEHLKTALEHMLRNSIDHGIDQPQARAERGKSETGNVSLIIRRQGSEFVIQLLDDGNGIDPKVLLEKAVERGLIKPNDVLSDEAALRLIFNSGLSTADEVTAISGRGVGMDAVHQAITQVGGFIDVQSKPGFFTQFDIRIPASIMINGALLATIGDEQVAVPLASLDGSDFRSRDEIASAASGDDGHIQFRDEEYQLRYLGVVRGTLPPPSIDSMPEFVPVLFAHHERRRVAFYMDSVTNAEELVIRSLGAQFTGVPGIAGGSLKSDGQPVLALDLNELIRQIDYADAQVAAATVEVDTNTLILCVDDSVMMRRTYEKRLQSLGYEVVTSVDGEAALDYLSETTRLPDFIFTDLEMPNMNGFDFIANLRRAPIFEAIPTVVVSSRDGDKHRAEAQRVGATDFMAKGANSVDGLRAIVERYLGKTALAS